MPVIDFVVFVIIVCLVAFYLLLRSGLGKKIGKWFYKETIVLKNNLKDDDSKGDNE